MSTGVHEYSNILSWVHFGDLHITRWDKQNYRDFLTLIAHANANLAGEVDFVVLPGDSADDGIEEQFLLVKQAIERLVIPLEILPGDRDAKIGSLELYDHWQEPDLWRTRSISGYRCLFLNPKDNGAAKGFGIGPAQIDWLKRELETAENCREWVILFMHTYPSELGDSGVKVQALMQEHRVLMVDIGHTHYNEIANDGRTIYVATHSTGPIEEGPAGFSVANIDDGVVSWKFKPLGDWPFVMITSPADQAFIVDPMQTDQLVRGMVEVRAKAWDARGVVSANCRVDNGPWRPMSRIGTSPVWGCAWESFVVTNGVHRITVQVQSADGREAVDTISTLTNQSGRYEAPRHPGDEANAIGAYPEKGILGTQLGPNKNGRK